MNLSDIQLKILQKSLSWETGKPNLSHSVRFRTKHVKAFSSSFFVHYFIYFFSGHINLHFLKCQFYEKFELIKVKINILESYKKPFSCIWMWCYIGLLSCWDVKCQQWFSCTWAVKKHWLALNVNAQTDTVYIWVFFINHWLCILILEILLESLGIPSDFCFCLQVDLRHLYECV